ncbi:hypothetical protein [Tellurirhabdus bombi]|uniref:hypothetical protein n=1 Tax=Tellurirhabdus bombi TaxID=2907205 RepID=UPI001F45AD1E|nr:hypothetical protein [Tellurirhabdus bombi]
MQTSVISAKECLELEKRADEMFKQAELWRKLIDSHKIAVFKEIDRDCAGKSIMFQAGWEIIGAFPSTKKWEQPKPKEPERLYEIAELYTIRDTRQVEDISAFWGKLFLLRLTMGNNLRTGASAEQVRKWSRQANGREIMDDKDPFTSIINYFKENQYYTDILNNMFVMDITSTFKLNPL